MLEPSGEEGDHAHDLEEEGSGLPARFRAPQSEPGPSSRGPAGVDRDATIMKPKPTK